MTVINHWGKWVSDNVPVTGVVSLNSLEHIYDLCSGGDVIDLTYEEGWREYIREKTAEMPYNPEIQPKAIVELHKSDPDKFADYWVIYGADFMATSSDDPSHPHGVWSCEIVGDWSKWNRELGNPVVWSDLPLTLRRYLVEFIDNGENKSEPSLEQLTEWQEEYSGFDQIPPTYLIGSWIQGEDGLYEPGEITDNFDYAAIVHCDSGVAQVVRSRWAIRAELCSPCYPGQAYIDNDGEFMGYDFPDWVYGDRRQNVDAVRFHRVDAEGQFWQVITPTINRMIGLDDNAITPVEPFQSCG